MFCYSTLGGAVCPGLTAPFSAIHSRECQLAITLTLVYLKEIQHFIAITNEWTHVTPLKGGLSLMLIWDIVFPELNCFSTRKNVASCHPRASFKCICASCHRTHLLWGKVNSILHDVWLLLFYALHHANIRMKSNEVMIPAMFVSLCTSDPSLQTFASTRLSWPKECRSEIKDATCQNPLWLLQIHRG